MPPWAVTLGLAVVIGVLILALGSTEALTIIVLMGVWFAVVGGIALLAEVVVQAIGKRVRRF